MTKTKDHNNTLIPLLGELFNLVAKIAVTIRVNSDFHPVTRNNPKTPEAVHWLSDALHFFEIIGKPLALSDFDEVRNSALEQAFYWEKYKNEIDRSSVMNMPGTEPLFKIDDGISLLKKIAET